MTTIVDAHVHFWDPTRLRYPWHADAPALSRPFLPADYRDAIGDARVKGCVFVECDTDPSQHEEEVDFVGELADDEQLILGIVAGDKVEVADGRDERLARLAAKPLVKGVRRILQAEADPAFCLRDDFVAGVQALADHDLSFDLCIVHAQLGPVIELVRRCPDVRFMLDHIGKPDIKAGLLDPWRDQIHELAGLRNVWCKLSGLVTEADHEAWTEHDLTPYISHALDSFGPARVLFGGDWPVSTLASTWPRWLAALDAPISVLNDKDEEAIFAANAIEFYRLDTTT